MLTEQQLVEYALTFPDVYRDMPFRDDTVYPVSYTHLDVYKRQALRPVRVPAGQKKRKAALQKARG